MFNVLVTGGAGFIGCHLIGELCIKGYDVTVLDNLSGGFVDNILSDVELVIGDITNKDLVNSLFERKNFICVYHLAAYAAEGLSHFIRKFNYENNLIGSINLINASVNTGVKRFIFTSSMAVYGSNQVPFKEDMIPAPEDPYGIAKYAVEQDLKVAYNLFGLEYVIVRPHNVYGTRQNIWDKYRNVIGIFINQVLNNKPMTIFGDGEQIRAFSHIDDIIPGLVKCLDADVVGEVINMGGEEPITINQLSEMVAEVFEIKCNKIYLDERHEVKIAYSDHTKMRNLLECLPAIKLKDFLPGVIEWARYAFDKRIRTGEFWNIEIEKTFLKFD